MTDTAIMRRQLRDALEELSDTIDNLVSLLDSFDAAEAEAYGFAFTSAVKADKNGDSESTTAVAVK